MILLIDNYDSFSYNLYQLIGMIRPDIKVIRNDEMTIAEIEALAPDHIIVSPGPGRPKDAGICEEVIDYFKGKIPIFGVCLGHQAICETFGGEIGYAKKLMHGKMSIVDLDTDSAIFKGMEPKLQAARYHSLAAEEDKLPAELKVIARTEDGEIMAVEHRNYPVYGVQFHPESILTPDGRKIMERFLKEIMRGEAEQSQVAAFLVALHMKGETAEEISACAEGMRSFATKLDRGDMNVIDIVGTGGDRSNTFNISTTAAIVTAAAGVAVAKHGNRAASSKCGTADCLETLGVNLMLEPEKNAKVLKDTNLCFLFAQKYHPAMRYVGPVRKAIGVPTVFNILGPLTNPAYNTYQLLGVYSEELLDTVANALKDLGLKHAMVVYGKDCLDEISMSADTEVCELADGKVTKYTITPEQFGFTRCRKEDLVGGTPEENAALVKEILEGKVTGAKLDAVLINAGAAIHVAKNVSMEEGIKEAREMITSGKALATMEQFIAETNAA